MSRRNWRQQCDVVLENFRPGTLERWGLGYAELAARNPKVVLVHVSGFGQTGPLAGQAGFGSVGEAMGGIRYTTGSPDRPPSRAGISLGDALASAFAVIGTLAALLHARATGRGQEVDVAIYEAVAALMESTMADYELAGVVRTRSGSVLPGVAPSNVYPTGDGAEVVVAANADTVFGRLCDAMGRPELADRLAFRDARGTGREHGRARRHRRRVDVDHAACDELLATAGRPRRAGRADLHRARHAQRPAVPGPRDGAPGDIGAGLGGADDGRRAAVHGRHPARSATPARDSESTPTRCSPSCSTSTPRRSTSCAHPARSGRPAEGQAGITGG